MGDPGVAKNAWQRRWDTGLAGHRICAISSIGPAAAGNVDELAHRRNRRARPFAPRPGDELRAETSNGRPLTATALRSVRLHHWPFCTDIRRMNETINETTKPSVIWDDRNRRGSADTCELRQMRLRMRLRLDWEDRLRLARRLNPGLPDIRQAPACRASRAVSSRQPLSDWPRGGITLSDRARFDRTCRRAHRTLRIGMARCGL